MCSLNIVSFQSVMCHWKFALKKISSMLSSFCFTNALHILFDAQACFMCSVLYQICSLKAIVFGRVHSHHQTCLPVCGLCCIILAVLAWYNISSDEMALASMVSSLSLACRCHLAWYSTPLEAVYLHHFGDHYFVMFETLCHLTLPLV